MSNKDKKLVDEQEKLLDHLIEYGGRQYIDEEIKKYEDFPELEPSKEFDDRMNRMFKDAYRKEVRHENIRIGKKIAVIAVATVGVVSAAAMNIKAVREPVLNFVFKQNNSGNKSKMGIDSTTQKNFIFSYLPNGYVKKSKSFSESEKNIIYKFDNANEKNIIYVTIQLGQKYSNYIDQSSSDSYEQISYKNHKYYYLAGKKNTLIFYKNNCIFSIMSSLPKSELLKIANALKVK